MTETQYRARYAEIERRYYTDSSLAVSRVYKALTSGRRASRYWELWAVVASYAVEPIQKRFEREAEALELEWAASLYPDFAAEDAVKGP